MNGFSIHHMKHRTLVLVLIAIAYFFLMSGNGIVTLTHPDEVFYAQSAREMIEHNSLWTPYIFDKPQFEKPIFFFWLLMAAFKFFGESYFVARFWPAFFGILGVVMTYWIAWQMFRNKRTAFLSALVLSTSFIYIALSRAILTDMVFSVWVILSIGFLYMACHDDRRRDFALIMACVISGIAVLTKGLLGICFPFGTLLIYLIWKRDFSLFKSRAWLPGIFLLVLIALPWHILMYQQYGQTFIDEYFKNVHVRRLFDSEHPKTNTWYFYPGLLFGGVMPWSIFWIPAAGLVWGRYRQGGEDQDKIRFLVSWIFGILLFVQVAASKLASYVFPAFWAVAIILGHTLSNAIENSPQISRKLVRGCGMFWAVVFVIVGIGAVIYSRSHIGIIVNISPIYVFSSLLAVFAAAVFFFSWRRNFTAMSASLCGITAALLITLLLGRSYAEPWVSCKQISDVFNSIPEMRDSDTAVLSSKFYVRGVRYYTHREMAVIDINGDGFYSPHPIPFLNTDEKVLDFLNTQPVTYGIIKESNIQDLERILPKGGFEMKHFKDIGGKYIVKIFRPNPQKEVVN